MPFLLMPVPGSISGLTLTRTSTTQVSVAPGSATDITNFCMMTSLGALAVDFTVLGAGGLDALPAAASSYYHIFLICKADGTVGALGSLLATPALPTGYVYYVELGGVYTDAGALVRSFSTGHGTAGTHLSLSMSDVDLGNNPLFGGQFQIKGDGWPVGRVVQVWQMPGPYSGKGTLADEAEMDMIIACARVSDAQTITVYWNCAKGPVRGHFKFNYLINLAG